jgi:hypothetical protein
MPSLPISHCTTRRRLPSRNLSEEELAHCVLVNNAAFARALEVAAGIEAEAALTPLQRAWIKSIGRVPGAAPPPGWKPGPPARPMAEPQGGYAGRPATRPRRFRP